VIDLSNVSISVDISMNLIDISNIQIHLDISNNERIVSMSKTEEQTVSKMIHETTHLFADVKETLIDISNNPQHVLNVKEEFLAVDLTQPLLPLDNK
jgi:hypothetical protein